MEEAIAVFDVGKSNKRFLIFSDDLKPVYSEVKKIDEIEVDGLLCDDAKSITLWMKNALLEALRRWRIKALSITTFGATIANLRSGSLRLPVISYNQEIEGHIRDGFYREFGSPLELYMQTGTPPYGQLLNAGIQVYWIREKYPEAFREIDEILFLPGYLTYVLTGFKSYEVTSVGCHTYLYDVYKGGWSNVAEELNVDSRLPEMFDVWEPLGEIEHGGLRTLVTPGIHDSNACLLPYIASRRDFLLASTGTWCVFMHPSGDFSPKGEDLHRDVLYYIDAYRRPVRSSRFKGGFEYDYYTSIIRDRFKVNPESITPETEIMEDILRRREDFITPGLVAGSGQFQRSKARIIGEAFNRSAKEAYHLLNIYLAIESYVAISLITGGKNVDIVVQGGFARNNMYLAALSALFPKSRVLKAIFPEATGLGAALCAKAALEGKKPHELDIRLMDLGEEEVLKPPIDIDALISYLDALIKEVSSND